MLLAVKLPVKGVCHMHCTLYANKKEHGPYSHIMHGRGLSNKTDTHL